MNWLILFIAGLFETVWAISLKYSNGFTHFWWSVVTVTALIISMLLLGISVKHLPIGTAYAVWTGIGAFCTAILGILLFNEPKDVLRIIFILLIVTGIIGLKLTSK